MNANLIVQLVEVAIAIAQSQLNPDQTAGALLTIVQRGVAAYEANTGQPINLALIKPEAPV
jgi:hypothetical protein